MLKKLLQEPLLHFLVIGAALFLLYDVQNDAVPEDNNKRIVITQVHIDRMSLIFEKQNQRIPTKKEIEGMIEHLVQEEVFYREALAMGLDKNDAGVRRRLAQKMKFIFTDIAEQTKPTDQELITYLKEHSEKFEIPGNITFEHIYFNSDKREKQTENDAHQLLTKLHKNDLSYNVQGSGDRFMYGYLFKQLTDKEIISMFGKPFYKILSSQPIGSWQGPFLSAYGLHLVKVENRTLSAQPEVKTVYDKLYREWLSEKRHEMNALFYQKLLQQYDIVIDVGSDTQK